MKAFAKLLQLFRSTKTQFKQALSNETRHCENPRLEAALSGRNLQPSKTRGFGGDNGFDGCSQRHAEWTARTEHTWRWRHVQDHHGSAGPARLQGRQNL